VKAEEVQAFADSGLSVCEAAKAAAVVPSKMRRLAARYGVTFVSKRGRHGNHAGRGTKTGLSAGQKAEIEDYYRNTPDADFSLAALSERMGVRNTTISVYAGKVGLTRRRRAPNSETLKKTQYLLRDYRYTNPASAAERAAWQESMAALRKRWKETETGCYSAAYRRGVGDRMRDLRAKETAESGPHSKRAKRGRRDDLGMFLRSTWEANYARYLNGLVADGILLGWQYEPKTFFFEDRSAGIRSYRPDFLVTYEGGSHFVEVKGWMDEPSTIKMEKMRREYPDVRVVMLGRNEYREFSADKSQEISHWE